MNINELYLSAQSGDKEAEKKLFQYLYLRFILFAKQRVWNEEDAEDLVQGTLLFIKEEYVNVQIQKSFVAWAYSIIHNRLLNYISMKKRRRDIIVPASDYIEDNYNYEPDPVLENNLLNCLKKICSVNRKYARILNLHYQGFTTEEVCRKLRLNRNHVYVLLHKARTLLERCLENGDID
ncbi:MAG: RNA polymerase sigma factor [candidate division Zixibacteria bacterium]|nr:RNA polymerase sigma factor [candidate division Zixibacteria bacterium]MDD5426724.1 RNA polymerase sigma factor [candidate division Zixibacteria bacterium]